MKIWNYFKSHLAGHERQMKGKNPAAMHLFHCPLELVLAQESSRIQCIETYTAAVQITEHIPY